MHWCQGSATHGSLPGTSLAWLGQFCQTHAACLYLHSAPAGHLLLKLNFKMPSIACGRIRCWRQCAILPLISSPLSTLHIKSPPPCSVEVLSCFPKGGFTRETYLVSDLLSYYPPTGPPTQSWSSELICEDAPTGEAMLNKAQRAAQFVPSTFLASSARYCDLVYQILPSRLQDLPALMQKQALFSWQQGHVGPKIHATSPSTLS